MSMLKAAVTKWFWGCCATRSCGVGGGPAAHGVLLLLILSQLGADHRTENFLVEGAAGGLAREIAKAAESYRKELAVEWLGKELPAWRRPCVIAARIHPRLTPGGRTTFEFRGKTAVDWEMSVWGPREAVLNCVLPHEIAHAVLATHFGAPLPRWIEEGACMSAERGESRRQIDEVFQRLLVDNEVMPVDRLLAIRDYPSDSLPVYAQANSVTQFLLQRGGKKKLISYLAATVNREDWQTLLLVHYGFESLSDLEAAWLKWAAGGDE